MPKLVKYLKVLAMVLAIGQIVGFALFIIEESLQTIMFATWQAPRGERELFRTVYRQVLDLGWILLYAIGWINPLAFLSFRTYFQAAEVWYLGAYILSKP